ncbi:MAG: hypothetical protein ABI625_19310 [bacterium]
MHPPNPRQSALELFNKRQPRSSNALWVTAFNADSRGFGGSSRILGNGSIERAPPVYRRMVAPTIVHIPTLCIGARAEATTQKL